ncbi:hypothetical protein PoB_007276200 [Plakobranchus ocellatus]|uniref:Uncharacterized protein n=1 Tax=Plakobranchus ocellatus TaxID=259542 RepID=A0AAV4DPS4_9GAST|nr:hypothetical protein PoB_007276200 [Plakobranchus ocellatus]
MHRKWTSLALAEFICERKRRKHNNTYNSMLNRTSVMEIDRRILKLFVTSVMFAISSHRRKASNGSLQSETPEKRTCRAATVTRRSSYTRI